MQEKIQIISDGSLDLSRELTRERDILVVPFYVSFDGETYLKEGVELDIREFYQRMVDHPDVFRRRRCRRWMIIIRFFSRSQSRMFR